MKLESVIKKLATINVTPVIGKSAGRFEIGGMEFGFVINDGKASYFGSNNAFFGHSVTPCINFARSAGLLN